MSDLPDPNNPDPNAPTDPPVRIDGDDNEVNVGAPVEHDEGDAEDE